MIFLGIFLNS
jgi:hypothetical protein